MNTALKISLVLVLLGAVIVGPVSAIPSPGPGVTPPSPGPGGQPVSPPSGNATPGPGTPDPSGGGNESGGIIPNPLKGFTDWFSGVVNALSNPWKTFQNSAEDVATGVVSRPIPMRNGDPALFLRPDNGMGPLWDAAWGMVALGVIVATIYAVLSEGIGRLIPPSIFPNRAASKARWQAIGNIPRTILAWPIVVGWLVLTQAVAKALMPSGQQLFPNGGAIADQAVAGGLAGLMLWFVGVALAILSILVIVLSVCGALLGPPLYPLISAFDPPDLPLIRHLKMLPGGGIIFSSIAAPVPTAAVLAVGYVAINIVRGIPTGMIPIVSSWPIGMAGILTVVVWSVALVAPIYMVVATHRLRPIAMIGAGLLGAAGGYTAGRSTSLGGSAASGGSGVASGAGRTVDPLKGSPFSRGGNSGGFGGALSDGGSSGAAGALGAGSGGSSTGGGSISGGSGAMAASGSSGMGSAVTGNPLGGDNGPSESTHSSAGTTTSTSVEETINSWSDLGEQQYEIGFQTQDGWQEAIGSDAAHSKEWLQNGAFDRIDQAYDGTVKIRGVQDGSLYDPHQIGNNER